MSTNNALSPIDPAADLVIVIEDASELTPKELELERKAQAEEIKKRSWMSHSAEELANRIPVSVFAMGSLASAD